MSISSSNGGQSGIKNLDNVVSYARAAHTLVRNAASSIYWVRPTRTASRRAGRTSKATWGRPKIHDTEGYACVESGCIFYKVTAAAVHALRRDGTRNQCEETAQWECGYCGSKHTAWFGTAQYRLKTPSATVSLALHMKGLAAADISEILELPESTIQRWLDRAGKHSERLHMSFFKHLSLRHIQMDELVTRVRKRVKRVWVWTGIDVQTRLLVAWVVEGRSQKAANRLAHEVYHRLKQEIVPAFTSDGLNLYYYAITAHWGSWTVVEGKRKPVGCP